MPTVTTLSTAIGAAMLAVGCAVSPVGPKDRDDGPIARCSGPACSKVATSVAWPDVRLADGTTPFNVRGAYTIQLPEAPLEFILNGDNGFIARYADRRWIGVQVLQAASIGVPRRDGAADTRPGALALADMPRILYTKTPADTEPTHAEDRDLWRLALAFKNGTFENATQLNVAERGPLVAYFADSGVGDTTGEIEVVHRRTRDAYLFVQLKGFSFDDVRRIVGSIEARKP
jgi:hypothetical protein